MRRITAALALIAALWTAALAEPYPVRTIRLIVPFPPGGPADVMGRLIAQCLTAAAQARPGAPQDFAAFIAAELPKWTAMAKLSNLKAE